MDTMRVHPKKNTRLIHIETPLAIINIYIGLTDSDGNRVENIQVSPNAYSGEPPIDTDGGIRSIRIIEQTPKDHS